MPKFGETMTEGTIFKWLKAKGEEVKEGENLFEIETDKATLEVESPADGILVKVLIDEGESAPIGDVVALIAAEGEEIEDINNEKSEESETIVEAKEEVKSNEDKDIEKAIVKEEKITNDNDNNSDTIKIENKVKASPAARNLAREKEIKLNEVKSTTSKDAITRRDVCKYLDNIDTSQKEEGLFVEKKSLNRIRKLTAQNMAESYRDAPHVTLTTEVNMKKIVNLKNTLRNNTDTHITFTDIIVKITAHAIADNPSINARFKEESIEMIENINIGIAVDTEKGLLVPVIENVHKMGLKKLSKAGEDLVTRAREGKLKKDELEDGTFTVTNLGSFNINIFTPIINTGEAAILGIGEIKEKPVVINGEIKIRPMMWLSLSFDHRIVDGAPAGRFLQDIKNLLEKPECLML